MKVFWPREGGLIVAADSSRGRKVLNERCPLCVFQGNLKREKETVAVRCVVQQLAHPLQKRGPSRAEQAAAHAHWGGVLSWGRLLLKMD